MRVLVTGASGKAGGAAPTRVSPAVERVLGRPPLTFADWVSEHLDAFR